MYTQLYLDVKLKKTKESNGVRHCIDYGQKEFYLPEIRVPLWAGSCYFDEDFEPIMIDMGEFFKLTSIGNIKNYHEEIEKFLEFIKPSIIS